MEWQNLSAVLVVMRRKAVASPESVPNVRQRILFQRLRHLRRINNTPMENIKTVTRRTRQRDLILKTLRNTDCHPTADWIYDQVKKEMPNISLGTVYRNLGTLKQSGEIMELSYGSKYSRFDGNPKNHYHFVCNNCDKVMDLHHIPADKEIEDLVARKEGVEVFFHRTEFYGLCSECSGKGKSDSKH